MRIFLMSFLCVMTSLTALCQKPEYFKKSDLSLTGVYYYPEHWDESQWDRDLKKMAELGFEFTHFSEFAWAQLEPEEGKYDFAWLDKAIATAAKYNIKVVLCTPTATPPVWLIRKYPEVLIVHENGTSMDNGARQHASFSSTFYREYSQKLIAELAKRYGNDTRVIGWQLDNEPHVTASYTKDSENRFRAFLRKKYNNNIAQLNKAWGTAFWSQVYNDFDQINFPKMAEWGQNPHQVLDFKRFFADDTATALDEQTATLKKYISPRQWVTTNYVPTYDEGHIGQSKNFDFHCYTRYMVYGEDLGVGRKGYRVGDPMRIPFANDFFRPIDGVYGVMELQPGQVNWGRINAQPLPGAVRLWLWSVFAGGSDFACAYRFRQPIYGEEQYHYGIVGSDGVTVTDGGYEYSNFIKEIAKLRSVYKPKNDTRPRTAILYNHENAWSMGKQRQTTQWNTFAHIQKYYTPLKSFGQPIDVISEAKDFSKYAVMIVPAYQLVDEALVARWKEYAENGGNVVFTCRTGQKDRNDRLFEAKFGEKMFDLIGASLDFYDLPMEHDYVEVVFDGKKHKWNSWGEAFTPYKDTEVWATYDGDFYAGKPAVIHRQLGKGTVTYVGVDTQTGETERAVLQKLYNNLQIETMNLPEGVWTEYRDGFGIALNYSDKTIDFPLPESAKIVIGNRQIKTADVVVWQY